MTSGSRAGSLNNSVLPQTQCHWTPGVLLAVQSSSCALSDRKLEGLWAETKHFVSLPVTGKGGGRVPLLTHTSRGVLEAVQQYGGGCAGGTPWGIRTAGIVISIGIHSLFCSPQSLRKMAIITTHLQYQ